MINGSRDEPANGFRSSGQVRLLAAPLVDLFEQFRREAEFKAFCRGHVDNVGTYGASVNYGA